MTEAGTPELKVATDSDTDREAIAVMVHGTFAAKSDDSGSSWWQAGSSTSERLREILPGHIRPAEANEVFHWSGDNSERSRSKAAAGLLRHLRSLEAQGYDYHLVGHSHGGSVVWKALKLSILTRRPLEGLKSWTTVGTPFLHHRTKGALNIKNVLGLIIGLLLIAPATSAPRVLATTLGNITTNTASRLTLRPDSTVGHTRFIRMPLLETVEAIGIPVERTEQAIYVGSYDPLSNLSMAEYYLATPEGLFLLVLTACLSYLFIHLLVLCVAPALEGYRIRLEQRLHHRAFDVYGSRWLGIWSPDDEAINGLRATLDLSVSFVRKIAPREVVYISDILGLLYRPYYWIFGPIYNRLVHPAIDQKIRTIVMRSAQGSDRPTATLVDVTPAPIPGESVPPLPALLNAKLLAYANRHAHQLVPKLRTLIGQPSFTSGLEAFGSKLTGNELVHTAYFEHDEVLQLLCSNMTNETESSHSGSKKVMPTWLKKWFVAAKHRVPAMDSPHAAASLTPMKDATEPDATIQSREAG